MRFITLLLCVCACRAATASTLDQNYVRNLTRARTPAAVAQATADFEDLKVARAACRIQVQRKHVPVACYETLNLEIRQGLRPDGLDRRRILGRLDELCRDSAAALNVSDQTSSGARTSTVCRKSLAEARAIRNYRDRRSDWSGY